MSDASDRATKAERTARLKHTGLLLAVRAWIDGERRRLRAAKGPKTGAGRDPESADRAWEIVWPKVEPVVRIIEKLRQERAPNPAGAIGYDGDPDELVDRGYTERDPGAIVRDSFLWAGFEFRRVVRDSEDGTSCLFERASTPPPTPLAIQIVEEYARRPAGDRLGLFQRLQLFATRTPETSSSGAKDTGAPPDPYLESLAEQGGA